MRNLKKILALVLALMMVLSVMVTASASFDDAESITYTEAVDVMVAAGVLNGMGDGTFAPTGTLTRAQAAKLIAYVKLGEDIDLITKTETSFSDVDATHWASGYVAFCAGRGYVVGNGDGTYAPDAPVTGYQFAKMLLLALGVTDTLAETDIAGNPINQYTGSDYAIKVALGMKGTPLRTGLEELSLNDELTREEAAQMAFNALSWGGANSILTTDFGVVKVADTVDKFGRPVINVWKKGTATVYSEVETALEKLNSADFDPTKTATGEKYEGYTFPNTVVYNGSVHTTLTPATLKDSNSINVELYGTVNLDGTVTVSKVVAYEYYFAQVTAINEATGDITLDVQEASAVMGSNTTVTVFATKTNNKYSADYTALANYKVGDVMALCVKQAWSAGEVNATWGTNILDVAEVTALTGTVTSTSIKDNNGTPVYTGSYVRIDGKKYEFASQYNRAAVTLGMDAEDGTFYTLNGKIVGFVPTVVIPTTGETFAYQVGTHVEKIEGTDAVVDKYGNVVTEGVADSWVKYIQVVLMDGTVAELPIAKYAADPNFTTDTSVARLIEITAYNAETGIYSVSTSDLGMATANNVNIPEKAIKIGSYYLTSAEYVCISGRQDKIEVTAGTQAGAYAAAGTSWIIFGAADANGNYTVSKVIYWVNPDAPVAPVYTDVLYASNNTVIETSEVLKEGDTQTTPVYVYSVYLGTEKTEIRTYTNLTVGMYEYTIDEYGVYVVKDINTGVVSTTVSNVYGALVSFTNSVQDYDVTNTVIVDLTTAANAQDLTNGNGKLDVTENVIYILGGTQTAPVIEMIYIVPGV